MFRSPHEMVEGAKHCMLEGREPETWEDWVAVMNFIAANLEESTALNAALLVATLYNMPLSETEVEEIVDFQLKHRAMVESARYN